MSGHTQGVWRVGDAGHTVFGPPNGNPSPETIATVKKPDNARLIVKAVNCHADLVETLEYAAKLITTARQYFPKSIKNSDTFQLENTCAAIGKALFKVQS